MHSHLHKSSIWDQMDIGLLVNNLAPNNIPTIKKFQPKLKFPHLGIETHAVYSHPHKDRNLFPGDYSRLIDDI